MCIPVFKVPSIGRLLAALADPIPMLLVSTAISALPMAGQALIGPKDFRVSHAGPDGDPRFDAAHEALAYDPFEGRYFVVWDANVAIPSPSDDLGGKRQVFGVLLDEAGQALASPMLLASAGSANDDRWHAANPEIVYNSLRREYLLVWEGTASVSSTAAKTEIFARRLDTAGSPLGPVVRVSFTGVDSDLRRDSSEPAVAFNEISEEYLVVYQFQESDDGSAAENEIHAQRLSASGLALLGSDIRISRMGPDGNSRFDAQDPAVAFAAPANEYLVVWRADDDRDGVVDGEFEIYGQRLLGNGAEIGGDDFRISRLGPDGDVRYRSEDATVAYDPVRDRYLVSWTGNADLGLGEEIYAELLGRDERVVRDDFRLSDMGPRGDDRFDVNETITRYNPVADEYVVAWLGEDDRGLLGVDEREVFVQRLSASDGSEIGVDDLRVSDMGPEGASNFDAFSLDVAIATSSGELLVVWAGDDDREGLVDGETEIFGQRLTLDGGCAETDTTLCLNDARFRIDVEWRAADGEAGSGRAVRLTGDTGLFWFFKETNVELIVKVLDARAVNGHFWVFYGALSNVQYTIRVTDSETGQSKTYFNPQGTLASRGDTSAFAASAGGAATPAPSFEQVMQEWSSPARMAAAPFEAAGSSHLEPRGGVGCQPTDTALCLSDSRFEVTVSWRSPAGETGVGKARRLTSDTGYFWFFSETNVELMIKVLDARPVNGRFWVFFGALSNVEYTITVRDSETGAERTYFNPSGTFGSQGDVTAF